MSTIRDHIKAFVEYCRTLEGYEKGEAQVFCDRLFQAFGHQGYKEAGGVLEFKVKRQGRGMAFADLLWRPRLLLEPLEVRADPELLRLAVSQLLENACKYSLPGSTVTIDAEEQMKCMAIQVSNSGSSIAAHDQRRIFDRFYRGADASHLAPGSGLGLYVARKIATAHGGTLDLKSQGQPNGDITFRFTIPSLEVEADHVVTTN